GQRFLKIEHPRSHAPVVGELRALLRDAVPKRGERVLPRRETALRVVGRQQSGEPQREVRLAFEGGLRAEPFRNTPAEAITPRARDLEDAPVRALPAVLRLARDEAVLFEPPERLVHRGAPDVDQQIEVPAAETLQELVAVQALLREESEHHDLDLGDLHRHLRSNVPTVRDREPESSLVETSQQADTGNGKRWAGPRCPQGVPPTAVWCSLLDRGRRGADLVGAQVAGASADRVRAGRVVHDLAELEGPARCLRGTRAREEPIAVVEQLHPPRVADLVLVDLELDLDAAVLGAELDLRRAVARARALPDDVAALGHRRGRRRAEEPCHHQARNREPNCLPHEPHLLRCRVSRRYRRYGGNTKGPVARLLTDG